MTSLRITIVVVYLMRWALAGGAGVSAMDLGHLSSHASVATYESQHTTKLGFPETSAKILPFLISETVDLRPDPSPERVRIADPALTTRPSGRRMPGRSPPPLPA